MMHNSQTQHPTHKKFQRHAFLVKRKLTAAIAFSTTLFLLCLENVKAFTTTGTSSFAASAVLNENTMLFFASGAHSLAHKWRLTQRNNRAQASSLSLNQHQRPSRRFLASPTSLKMAFGFDTSPSSPPMLDMKTSISAFGGWYNTMDPVARPPIYDEYVPCFFDFASLLLAALSLLLTNGFSFFFSDTIDFSLLSPSDSWPTSMDDDGLVLASISTLSHAKSVAAASGAGRRRKTPRPVRTIRRIAGWVLNGSTRAVTRGFESSQTFI
jgi:hypothetical protein